MGKYTVISDVGKAIVDMIKDQMVPEPVAKAEQVGICDPKERGGFVVGVHPYNIDMNTAMNSNVPIVLPDGSMQDPPKSYQMSYMISIASKAEAMNRAIEEQRILGRLIQLFADNPNLPDKYMPEVFQKTGERIAINMLPMEMEEKVKIWSMYSEPYKLSVFYSVGPILVESGIIKPPAAKRVTSFEVDRKYNR